MGFLARGEEVSLPKLLQGIRIQRRKLLKLNVFDAKILDEICKDTLYNAACQKKTISI
jgi:hypothetical protein